MVLMGQVCLACSHTLRHGCGAIYCCQEGVHITRLLDGHILHHTVTIPPASMLGCWIMPEMLAGPDANSANADERHACACSLQLHGNLQVGGPG